MSQKNKNVNLSDKNHQKKAKKKHRLQEEEEEEEEPSSSSSPSTVTTSMEEYKRELKEVEILREVIIRCNDIPSKCRAVQVALKALDNEAKKIRRDEKLRQKFCSNSIRKDVSEDEDESMSDEYHKVQKQKQNEASTAIANSSNNNNNINTNGDDLLMEWQDVKPPPRLLNDDAVTSDCQEEESNLGRSLCDASVRAIASSNTLVDAPLSAVALAIHGALVCDDLRFKCTGIPSVQKKNGFAAPIRELPKGRFLPDQWDAHSQTHVSLRYRKDGYGATALLLVTFENHQIHLYFGPSGDQKEKTPQLRFNLNKHINLDSFDKALSSSITKRVPPSLHYKSLAILMTEFAKCVDLGQTYIDQNKNNKNNNGDLISTLTQQSYVPPHHLSTSSTKNDNNNNDKNNININDNNNSSSSYQPPNVNTFITTPSPFGKYVPPLLQNAKRDSILKDDILQNHEIHQRQPMRGDFETDLNPLLVSQPSLLSSSMTGNLMGPNHPSFQRHCEDPLTDPGYPMPGGFPLPGGLGMQPRFDAYYPPGVTGPGGRGPGRGRGRRHPTNGDPNPDLLKPPSNLGDNMFM